jgi:CRP-like cAMP-binding protein
MSSSAGSIEPLPARLPSADPRTIRRRPQRPFFGYFRPKSAMFDAIDRFVAQYLPLTDEERTFFHSLLKHRKVAKKTFLLKEGEVCDFEAFILKGCIRTYYLDKEGVETILLFAVEDWWVSDITSFSERKPSNLFVETLEECELLTIDYAGKSRLFEKIPAFERMFRLLVQRSLGVLQQRFYSSISETAEQRYKQFLEKYPLVAQRVPQHQIARYIGVSPEFLSKVRSTMFKKH